MNTKQITEVAEEVVSLEEIRLWCKVDDDVTEDDALLESLITSARIQIEEHTGLFIGVRNVLIAYDAFPCGNALELGYPVRAITGLTYVDPDSVTQTLDPADYTLDDFSKPSWLILRSGSSWPSAGCVANGIQIAATVGYGLYGDSPADSHPCPSDLITAIKLAVNAWYENREDVIVGTIVNTLPVGVLRILQSKRINMGV